MVLNPYHKLFVLHDENEKRGGDVLSHYKSFIKSIEKKGFKFIGSGGTRKVWERRNFIIKVPLRGDGIIDNIVESLLWRKYRDRPTSRNIRVAPSRFISNGCLLMVRVDRARFSNMDWNNIPKWTKNMADSFQGGFYKDKLVVYDYALEAPEREEWEKQWGVRSEILHCRGWQAYRAKVLFQEPLPFEEK